MASPKNPLDKYVSYTYHFELHASSSYDEIAKLSNDDQNQQTTRSESTGTLLINTRRDAHQTIDDVRFQYIAPDGDPSGSMAIFTEIHLTITEAGGSFFADKLRAHSERYQCGGSVEGLVFGLKILFVGRNADNSIETVPVNYVIPMMFATGSSKFNFKGGINDLTFTMASSGTKSERDTLNSRSLSLYTVNKAISIKAKTVSEALVNLEKALNDNYENIYRTQVDNVNKAKPVRYKINNNLGVDGALNSTSIESYVPGSPVTINFLINQDINSMIRSIVTMSAEINQKVGSSINALKQTFHAGAFIPKYTAHQLLTDKELFLVFDIDMYTGGENKQFVYEFDFLFSEPGKNVDVLDFEMNFSKINTIYYSKTTYSTEKNTNFTSTVSSTDKNYYISNVVTEDTTRKSISEDLPQKQQADIPRGSYAGLPLPPKENSGQSSTPHSAVPARRLAFEANNVAAAAAGYQVAFSIRGHPNLLGTCIPTPDGKVKPFGIKQGCWIKVNIKSEDGEPFFYTGYYQVFTVDNVFSGGKFTQLLSCAMLDK